MLGEAPALGGQGGRLPGRPERRPASRRRTTLDTSDAAAARGARRARGRASSSELGDGARADASTAGSCCPSPTRAFGEAKAAVDEHFVAEPDEELEHRRRRATTSTVYAFERGGKEELDGRPEPDRPHRAQAQDHVLAAPAPAPLRHHPGAAGRSSRRPSPGEAPPTPERRPRRSRSISRDHGARPRRRPLPGRHAHDRRRGSCSGSLCYMLHRRDQRVAEVRGHAPAPARRPDRRGPVPPRRRAGRPGRRSSRRSAWSPRSCWPRAPPRSPSARPTSAASCPAASRPSASRCAST